MPAFKPAYLVCGDDHGRIAERRARLRRVAERESGAGGLEIFEGEAATPEAVATALASMTLALGRRFLIVDGVEGWGERDVQSTLAPALAQPPPETTVAFFAREEGRTRAPDALREAVAAAGGEVAQELKVKPWELPKWVQGQAPRLGLRLDSAAARTLVAHVGDRQQRLLRELEKLALVYGPPDPQAGPAVTVSAEQVEEFAANSAERQVWTLADSVVARDPEHALRTLVSLRCQGERLPALIYRMSQRLRLSIEVSERLARGESEATVRRSLRMPPKAAAQFLSDVRDSDLYQLRGALETLSQLELDSRGGIALEEDTVAVRAVLALSGGGS